VAPCGYRLKSTYQNKQLYKTKPVGTRVSIYQKASQAHSLTRWKYRNTKRYRYRL